jgi:hypothetical protein
VATVEVVNRLGNKFFLFFKWVLEEISKIFAPPRPPAGGHPSSRGGELKAGCAKKYYKNKFNDI